MRGCGEVLVGSTLRIVPHESVDATMRGQNQTIPTREGPAIGRHDRVRILIAGINFLITFSIYNILIFCIKKFILLIVMI